MSELKPCPFCGGAARAFKRTCDKDTRYDPADRAFPIVRCGACGACSEGDDWTELQTAIDRWNRRAQPALVVPSDVARAVAAEREACARQCEDIYSWRGAYSAGPMCTPTLEAAAAAIRARGHAAIAQQKGGGA